MKWIMKVLSLTSHCSCTEGSAYARVTRTSAAVSVRRAAAASPPDEILEEGTQSGLNGVGDDLEGFNDEIQEAQDDEDMVKNPYQCLYFSLSSFFSLSLSLSFSLFLSLSFSLFLSLPFSLSSFLSLCVPFTLYQLLYFIFLLHLIYLHLRNSPPFRALLIRGLLLCDHLLVCYYFQCQLFAKKKYFLNVYWSIVCKRD